MGDLVCEPEDAVCWTDDAPIMSDGPLWSEAPPAPVPDAPIMSHPDRPPTGDPYRGLYDDDTDESDDVAVCGPDATMCGPEPMSTPTSTGAPPITATPPTTTTPSPVSPEPAWHPPMVDPTPMPDPVPATVPPTTPTTSGPLELCRGPAFGGYIPGAEHWWLRGDDWARGQGSDDDTLDPTDTEWTDQRANVGDCAPVTDTFPEHDDVDPTCVEERTTPGTPLGTYIPFVNYCHSVVEDVLDECDPDTAVTAP